MHYFKVITVAKNEKTGDTYTKVEAEKLAATAGARLALFPNCPIEDEKGNFYEELISFEIKPITKNEFDYIRMMKEAKRLKIRLNEKEFDDVFSKYEHDASYRITKELLNIEDEQKYKAVIDFSSPVEALQYMLDDINYAVLDEIQIIRHCSVLDTKFEILPPNKAMRHDRYLKDAQDNNSWGSETKEAREYFEKMDIANDLENSAKESNRMTGASNGWNIAMFSRKSMDDPIQ